MAKESSSVRRAPAARVGRYWARSKQPFHALIFLLPLIVFYEVGTILMHQAVIGTGEPAVTIRAYSLLVRFFELFGAAGYYLPGPLVVVVLLLWHILDKSKDKEWRPDFNLYLLMGLECLVLSLPLLVWGLVFFRDSAMAVVPISGVTGGGGGWLLSLTSGDVHFTQELVLSIGAGIYEELLFRLVAIAMIHTVLVDLLSLPEHWGMAGAVVVSAVAFGLYHFPSLQVGQWTAHDWLRLAFYTSSGVFLAVVYILRGFGIVAGTHAVYDILISLLQWMTGG